MYVYVYNYVGIGVFIYKCAHIYIYVYIHVFLLIYLHNTCVFMWRASSHEQVPADASPAQELIKTKLSSSRWDSALVLSA